MSRFKTLKTETIDKNFRWEYKKDKIKLPNGKKTDYFYIESLGASFVVPILDDGRLVLVTQYRYLRDKLSVEFPGGAIEKEMTAIETANTELLEESGYKAGELTKAGEFDAINGLLRETSHIFIGAELKQIGEPTPEESEEGMQVIYRRVDEFEEMISRGDIWDGQTLAAWMIARKHVLKIIREYGLQTN